MSKNDNESLLILGMKVELVNKLSKPIVKNLVAFAMDHIKAHNLLQMLIQLASMEIRGKPGASSLAMKGIATVEQLKDLTAAQLADVLIALSIHKDVELATKDINKMLIMNQQEKLYFASGGQKGEYYIFRDEPETEREKIFK